MNDGCGAGELSLVSHGPTEGLTSGRLLIDSLSAQGHGGILVSSMVMETDAYLFDKRRAELK